MRQKRKKRHKKNIYLKLRKRLFFVGMFVVLLGGFVRMAVYTVKELYESVWMGRMENEEMMQYKAVSIDTGTVQSSMGNKTAIDETVDKKGEKVYTDIILVNKEHSIPEDYFVSLISLRNGQQVASVMYEDLCNMLSDGEEQERGLSFLIASGYRTKQIQEKLMEDEIQKNMWCGMAKEEAQEDALLTVAPAGYSEHETGLAVDIVAVTNQRLDETQEDTRENQWLQENCYKYGFILRYPMGKEDVTGFSYESWHFRYVGVEAATEITEKGITLEEYLER